MSASDGSSSESGDEGSEGLGLQGYQFELTIVVPPGDSSSDEECAAQISGSGKIYLPTSSEKGRANNKTWCLCGMCKPVENDEACVCIVNFDCILLKVFSLKIHKFENRKISDTRAYAAPLSIVPHTIIKFPIGKRFTIG